MRILLVPGLAALAIASGCDDAASGPVACLDAPCPRLSDAGYVRTGEADGMERYWSQAGRNCVTVHPGPAADLGDDALHTALRNAAATWSEAAMRCVAAMCIRVGEPVDDAMGYTHGDRNVVGVVTDTGAWGALPETSPTALAVTISHVNASTGEIVGADIAINRAHHAFSQRREGPRQRENDLQSVLLHELGHLVGFDHPPMGTDSVMVEHLNLGDARRDLTALDVIGVCETHARPDDAANHRRTDRAREALPQTSD